MPGTRREYINPHDEDAKNIIGTTSLLYYALMVMSCDALKDGGRLTSVKRNGPVRPSRLTASSILLLIFVSALVLEGCGGQLARVVTLDSGQVQGTVVGGIQRYLGIPYAAPPVGALRWREPQPVKPWQGVRVCDAVGLECPQVVLKRDKKKAPPMSEDCLYLNVWTPAGSAAARLPVMFWIHGGAFQLGSGGLPLYDGQKLAERGVVVVDINYRLGPFGFLAHPLLTSESPNHSSGNYGLLDQQAAMRWVQRNIAAFGGDPGRVTMFGESAGAMSVLDQMVSPLASGLFHQAISESTLFIDHGLLMHATRPLAQAEGIGVEYSGEIGCSTAPDVLAAMRAKPAKDLLSLKLLTRPGVFIMDPKFVPTVDGWAIPADPGTLVAQGKQAAVPLLLGSNLKEGNLFTVATSAEIDAMSVETYQKKIREYFGAYADQVLAMFPVTKSSEIRPQMSEVFTIFDFTSVARFAARSQLARGQRVYLYQFDRTPPLSKTSVLGPCHGSELPFVFGNLVKGNLPDGSKRTISNLIVEGALRDFKKDLIWKYDRYDVELSSEMVGYWTTFAKTGDPNGGGRPAWPPYVSQTYQNIELAKPVGVASNLDDAACNLADQFYGYVK
jgi:para-nitrobenzyl esterase